MKILSRDTSGNRLNGPLPIDPETDLYSRNFFLLRLKEERERTKRTEIPFSVVVVDVEGMSTALNGKSKRSTRIHPKKLVKGVVGQSRKIDIKGWFDLKSVGILMLMPGTKNSGALEFKEKIYTQIRQDYVGAKRIRLEEFMRVSTFGDGSSDGTGSALNRNNKDRGWSSLEDNPVYAKTEI